MITVPPTEPSHNICHETRSDLADSNCRRLGAVREVVQVHLARPRRASLSQHTLRGPATALRLQPSKCPSRGTIVPLPNAAALKIQGQLPEPCSAACELPVGRMHHTQSARRERLRSPEHCEHTECRPPTLLPYPLLAGAYRCRRGRIPATPRRSNSCWTSRRSV